MTDNHEALNLLRAAIQCIDFERSQATDSDERVTLAIAAAQAKNALRMLEERG